MNDRELDRLMEEYLDARQRGDFPTMDRIWDGAAFDRELENALDEIHAAFNADDREREDRAAGQTIAGSVETHFRSAEIVPPLSGPVTVGDVARELFLHAPDRLPAEDHSFNRKLHGAPDELPGELGLSKLMAWAESRFGTASRDYWRAFRSAALKLERRRASAVEYQLAARRAPKPEGPK